jgi:hypothetical protein
VFFFEKFGGKPGASCFKANLPLQSKYPRIDENFFLSHNFVKHYVSTILQKEVIRNVAKSLNMLEVESQESQPKKLSIFISENSQIFFWGIKVDFQKNKIIHHRSAKLEKILWYLH